MRNESHWIPAFAGMTEMEVSVGGGRNGDGLVAAVDLRWRL